MPALLENGIPMHDRGRLHGSEIDTPEDLSKAAVVIDCVNSLTTKNTCICLGNDTDFKIYTD